MRAKTSGPPTAEDLVFVPSVAERLGTYVYLLIDPRDDKVFYVGEGRGDRAYCHAHAARGDRVDGDRKHAKIHRIQEIHRLGLSVGIEILRHNLGAQSFVVEAAAIDLARRMGADVELANIQSGHGVEFGLGTVADLAARYAARPLVIRHSLMLIRPSTLWPRDGNADAEYEATRGWWRSSATRRTGATHAAAVVDGIVRAVWRISSWETHPSNGRVRFTGSRDPELEAEYAWCDASGFLPHGAQNPIRYIDAASRPVR